MNTELTKRYLSSLNHKVTEVRILRKDAYFRGKFAGTIISGYYENDKYDKLLQDIEAYDQDEGTKCIWTTLQACTSSLLARGANRLRTGGKLVTTEDSNIDHFTVFPIDIDSNNPTETSASLDELKVSAAKAKHIHHVITEELELPAVKAMSGNGCHILIYLEPLSATEENINRFKASGDIIKALYGTDPTNYNPARCWKLYGTMVRKGDSIKERPHRRAELLDFPDEIQRVSFTELETKLLTIAPEELRSLDKPKSQKKRQRQQKFRGKKLPPLDSRNDLEALARECGAVPNSEWKQKADYEICRTFCPLCKREDHGKLTYGSGGECGYSCHSNTCSGKNFQDLYESAGFSKSEFQEPYNPPAPDTEPVIETGFEKPPPPTFDIIENQNLLAVPVFPKELLDLAPFNAYIKAFEGKTEVCPAFHFANLLTGIGSVIGRKAYYNGIVPLYPNFYTCICGQTGASRKSTALTLGALMLEKIDPYVIQIEGLATPEGLVRHFSLPHKQTHGEMLEDYNESNPIGIDRYMGGDFERLDGMLRNSDEKEGFRGLAIIDEMASLFKKAGKAGSEGLLQKLAEFYDNKPRIINPSSKDPTRALNPCLSLTGATTISWLEGNIQAGDITGGIGRRFVYFVDQGEMTDIPLTKPADEGMLTVVKDIVKGLRKEIAQGTRALAYDADAEKVYSEWYYEQRQRQRDEENEILKSTGEGIHVHVQKSAIIFALLQNTAEENLIKDREVSHAILLAEYLRECQQYLFTSLATNIQEKIDQQVLDALIQTPWLTSRQLYRKLRVSSEFMRKTIENLLNLQIIGVDASDKAPKYAVREDEIK